MGMKMLYTVTGEKTISTSTSSLDFYLFLEIAGKMTFRDGPVGKTWVLWGERSSYGANSPPSMLYSRMHLWPSGQIHSCI